MIGSPPVDEAGVHESETFAVVGSYVYERPTGAGERPAGMPVATTALPRPVSATVVTRTW